MAELLLDTLWPCRPAGTLRSGSEIMIILRYLHRPLNYSSPPPPFWLPEFPLRPKFFSSEALLGQAQNGEGTEKWLTP